MKGSKNDKGIGIRNKKRLQLSVFRTEESRGQSSAVRRTEQQKK